MRRFARFAQGLRRAARLAAVMVLFVPASSYPTWAVMDRELRDRVRAVLRADIGDEGAAISIDVEDGVVLLSGVVGNLLARDRAAQIVARIESIRAVVSELEVRLSHRDDLVLAGDVQEALERSPLVSPGGIRISVANGQVALVGQVRSYSERWAAEDAVRAVRGIQAVHNRLEVARIHRRSDRAIRRDVERNLELDARVNPALIDVTVDDAIVRLGGSVATVGEAEAAAQAAWVIGVRAVDTERLCVNWRRCDLSAERATLARGRGQRTDDDIAAGIEDALRLDSRLGAARIRPRVAAGIVSLTGRVESLAAARLAVETARRTPGVVEVANLLLVERSLRPSEWLRADVERALAFDPVAAQALLGVDVEDGRVTLRGTAPSEFVRERAIQAVESVAGVVTVRVLILTPDGP